LSKLQDADKSIDFLQDLRFS